MAENSILYLLCDVTFEASVISLVSADVYVIEKKRCSLFSHLPNERVRRCDSLSFSAFFSFLSLGGGGGGGGGTENNSSLFHRSHKSKKTRERECTMMKQ